MQGRHLWFAASFAVIPFVVFACGGGRSDIDLLLEAAAGSAGAAGKGGGGGSAGQTSAGSAGVASVVCKVGAQVECACPATSLKGVQVCNAQGTGFDPCTGCPSGQGGSSSQGGQSSAGGNNAGGSNNTGGGNSGGKAGEPADAGSDFFDALPFPLPDSGPVGECVGCLQENCNDAINKCYNDPNCVDGIQCAITDCFASSALGGGPGGQGGPGGLGGLGGGNGLDFQCLLGCFGGDPTAVFAAVQTFQCITQTCGDQCGGGILGDGGGFPLGGLGGGPTPGNPPVPGAAYMQGVRIPQPEEVPGFPRLQKALSPRR